MPKTLLDCGNCGPDFNAIRQMVTANFRASVVQSHGAEDTLRLLRTRQIDLVTVNRKLDRDYSDGLAVIQAIKADPDFGSVPVMLVTNYEEHQRTAIAAGCVLGFGKLAINEAATREALGWSSPSSADLLSNDAAFALPRFQASCRWRTWARNVKKIANSRAAWSTCPRIPRRLVCAASSSGHSVAIISAVARLEYFITSW